MSPLGFEHRPGRVAPPVARRGSHRSERALRTGGTHRHEATVALVMRRRRWRLHSAVARHQRGTAAVRAVREDATGSTGRRRDAIVWAAAAGPRTASFTTAVTQTGTGSGGLAVHSAIAVTIGLARGRFGRVGSGRARSLRARSSRAGLPIAGSRPPGSLRARSRLAGLSAGIERGRRCRGALACVTVGRLCRSRVEVVRLACIIAAGDRE